VVRDDGVRGAKPDRTIVFSDNLRFMAKLDPRAPLDAAAPGTIFAL